MELNRNHFFVLGTILLGLGIQLRFVDSFVLNSESTRFVEERLDWNNSHKSAGSVPTFLTSMTRNVTNPMGRRHVVPPKWLKWSMISAGAVLMLYSLAMRRPD